MNLLLTAATPAELAPTLDWLRSAADRTDKNVLTLGQLRIEVLFSGIGTVSTAYVLGQRFASTTPDLAIMAGICGAYDRSLELGQVVRVSQERNVHAGGENRDESLLDFPDMGFDFAFPFSSDGWLQPADVAAQYLPYRSVRGGTTDRSSGSQHTIDRIRTHYPGVQVESMEGAAFFYACKMAGVTPLQIRSVSNYVEPRNRANWKIREAISSP